MMNAQEIEGLPIPELSMQGTEIELTERLGKGFQFTGGGWYGGIDRMLLIVPLQFRDDADNPLRRLLNALGLDTSGDQRKAGEEARYACYSWTSDPRPTMTRLLRLGDQTELAVPQALFEAWPRISAVAVELKAWADNEIARMAAEHGGDGASMPEVPVIGECPAHLTKDQVEHIDVLDLYKFGPYAVHLMTAESVAKLQEQMAPVGVPPYARLFTMGEVGVAVSLQPRR